MGDPRPRLTVYLLCVTVFASLLGFNFEGSLDGAGARHLSVALVGYSICLALYLYLVFREINKLIASRTS